MNTIIVLFGLAVLIAVIYKLINHKDKTPDPLEKAEAEVKAKLDEVLRVAETPAETPKAGTCGCGRSPTGNCMGLHKLSDAEWAMHDLNPNRVAVAPVVVTADTPSETVAEAEPVATKKPRAKKVAAPKAKASPKAPKKSK